MRHSWSVDSITIILHLPVTPDSSFPMLHPSVFPCTNIAIALISLNLKSVLHFSTYKINSCLTIWEEVGPLLGLRLSLQASPTKEAHSFVQLVWLGSFVGRLSVRPIVFFHVSPQKLHFALKMKFRKTIQQRTERDNKLKISPYS